MTAGRLSRTVSNGRFLGKTRCCQNLSTKHAASFNGISMVHSLGQRVRSLLPQRISIAACRRLL